MPQLAEQQDTYQAAFDAFRRDPAFGTGADAAARTAAFDRFITRGFPTTRDEAWRHTNIAPLAALSYARAAAAVPDAEALAAVGFDGVPHTAVVVNGRLSAPLSSLAGLPAGVSVRSGPVGPVPDVTDLTAFVDLNGAFAEQAIVVDVAAKVVLDAPLHLAFVAVPGPAPALISPRLVVRAAEGAQVTIVESYTDLGAGVTFTNVVSDIQVAPGAFVDHVKLERQSAAAFHLATTIAHTGRAGTFRSHSVTLGGRIARNDIISVLGGEGAECTLNGLYVATGEALVDTHTTIDHAMPHCPSHEVYKGILAGRARAVFNGKIIVRPDAQKTDAKQTNKALLLTDDAQINTKPQLEIFADDVKCTHGAAIGQLDEDALFYLRARGIGLAAARTMLIHAFAGDVLNGVRVASVREAAMRLVEAQLSI
jgi:Fe-S cluster assembly protein SufD